MYKKGRRRGRRRDTPCPRKHCANQHARRTIKVLDNGDHVARANGWRDLLQRHQDGGEASRRGEVVLTRKDSRAGAEREKK